MLFRKTLKPSVLICNMVKPAELGTSGNYVRWEGEKGNWSLLLQDENHNIAKISFFAQEGPKYIATWARKDPKWSTEEYMREKAGLSSAVKGRYLISKNRAVSVFLDSDKIEIIFPAGLPDEKSKIAIVKQK